MRLRPRHPDPWVCRLPRGPERSLISFRGACIETSVKPATPEDGRTPSRRLHRPRTADICPNRVRLRADIRRDRVVSGIEPHAERSESRNGDDPIQNGDETVFDRRRSTLIREQCASSMCASISTNHGSPDYLNFLSKSTMILWFCLHFKLYSNKTLIIINNRITIIFLCTRAIEDRDLGTEAQLRTAASIHWQQNDSPRTAHHIATVAACRRVREGNEPRARVELLSNPAGESSRAQSPWPSCPTQ